MSIADETKEALKAAKELDGVFGSMRENIQANARELGAFKNPAKDAKALYSQLDAQLIKLQNQEEGLSRLTDKQLQATRAKSLEIVREIELKAQDLVIKRGLGKLDSEQLRKAAQKLEAAGKITEAESALLAAKADGFTIEKETLGLINQEVGFREKSNANLGVAGNLLKGVKSLGSFADAFKLDEVAKAMEEAADEAARVGDGLARGKVLSAGLKAAAAGLAKTLSDPSVIIGALIKGFKEVDKANVDFQRSTGQSANNFTSSFAAAGSTAITLADYIKTAGTLTKELGQNAAAIFSPDDIAEAAEMTEAMGMAGKEAANLARLSKINGGNLKAQNEALVAGVNAANKQNKTAVATGDVLKEVANTSEGIAISYAGYPEKLASAAATAASLGMTLADIDRISSSLLQFQSSIEAEMEAELLTGRQLNLEKARQLALDNDLEGVAKELSNQGITSANFSKMNRIQQEAQAKALGMNRDEMAKMLLQQELANGLSEDALSAAQKQTLEQLKSQEATEKFQKALDGLAQAFAPIVGFIAKILSSKVGLFAIQGIILTIVGAQAIKGAAALAGSFSGMKTSLKDMYGGAKSLAKGLKEAFDQGGLLGKMYKGGQFMPGGGRAEAGGERGGGILGLVKTAWESLKGKEEEEGGVVDKVKDKVKDMVGGGDKIAEAADATKGAAAGGAKQGKDVKGFLKGLGDGLKAMSGRKVLQGALNLIPAALGFVAMTAGAIGLAAVALAGNAAGIGLQGLSTGLTIFANAMATPTPLGPVGLVAPVALALLGASMIPFAYALSVAAPAIEAIGTIIHAVFTGIGVIITSVAEGFATFMEVMTPEKALILPIMGVGLMSLAAGILAIGASSLAILPAVASLTLLGLAMIPLSIGMERMAGADTQGIITSLATFAGLAPGLIVVGASLFSIAGGLGAMAVAGLAALPVMAALAGLGTVATGISSIFGGDEEGEEATPANNDTAILAQKLDQMNVTLNAILAKEGTVTLDGTKVGTALTVASSKLQ